MGGRGLAGRGSLDPGHAAVAPVLLLAGCAERRSQLAELAREALSRADFPRLTAELYARGLLPLIGSRALELAPDICPPSFDAAVKSARAAARARGLALEAEITRLVARLGEAGISALPLKGPLLAADVHGDVGLRETRDVDLLVPRARLYHAGRLLRADGYGPPLDPLRRNGLPDLHLRLSHDSRPRVELHWRVHWYEDRFSEEMLAGARPSSDGLLRAQPSDLAASLLLFYARDGFHGLRLAIDLATWWDRHGDVLSGGFLEGHARRHPDLVPALTAAVVTTQRLTGAPALDWLGSAAIRDRRITLAARLCDWAQVDDRDQRAANVSLVDALLAPPGSLPEFARRELIPRSGAALPHMAKMLGRYAVALWRSRQPTALRGQI